MSHTIRQMLVLASLVALLVAVGSPLVSAPLWGQVGNNGGNNNQGNNNQGNAGGIKIDASGVVSLALANDASGSLDKKRREALAKKLLNADVNQSSKLRYVSLVELEKTVDALLSKPQPIPDDVFYLAGLQRIEEVFVLPETKDLVIAGPAEGFAPDAVGRMLGVASARPVLRLDDLAVALRTATRARHVGCSIDPVPERLAELVKFIKQGGPSNIEAVEERFKQMDDILGLQDVRVEGVPADSHFGVAFVEADYRMKRIAIGLENPGVKGMKSHLQMLGSAGGNAMQRWWFVPLYDGIYRSEDGLAFQFAGPRAQLLAEEELADAGGNRFSAPTTRVSIKAFSKHFTEKFPDLAAKSPVFGELQNLIDWTVFAALIQKERLAEKVDWKMATLLDEQRLTLPVYNAPKKIPSSVNYKRTAGSVVGLVCGGVVINPGEVLNKVTTPATDAQRLDALREAAGAANRIESHRWWWDATR
jgi:Protein of unknown function (DUF1598)